LLHAFEDKEVNIATLGIRQVTLDDLSNPNRIKIVVDEQHQALYFSRSCIPNYTNSPDNPLAHYPFLRHIGLYAYRAAILESIAALKPTELERIESLEQLRWIYYGYKIKIVETDIETPNIDVPEDVDKVIRLL
jgi:3-deoxy-manno-octulosonate cytidylyltransferase (CMP-KDO synthetase)